jgi:muramoyltetrapeptide carboxypeptidase
MTRELGKTASRLQPSAFHAPLRPAALHPGSRLRLVSPASGFDRQKAEQGAETLRKLGYVVDFSANAFARDGQYTAGTVRQRLEDLHAAFADPTVDGIVCNRGGYGSAELLSGVDLDLIERNPKIFVGCSDITSLQTWLHDTTGLVAFHGPMAAGDFARDNGVDTASWNATLCQEQPWRLGSTAGLETLKPGTAQGKFYGGCLSLLAASLGTPYEIHTTGTVLFLEDIGAKPYQIERMLLQLRLVGKLDHVRGIVFGAMTGCMQPGAPEGLLRDVLRRVLADFDGPVAIGLRSGHVERQNITVPIGVQCSLDLTSGPTLQFLEPSVRSKPHA